MRRQWRVLEPKLLSLVGYVTYNNVFRCGVGEVDCDSDHIIVVKAVIVGRVSIEGQ